MMEVNEIMDELRSKGSESIKKILLKHGVKEPFFGVKIAHLKTIQKKIKINYQLANNLYATGNADAMYLAGLIADDGKMTKADLQTWVEQAVSDNISGYTVPWVAAGSNYGYQLALEWINSSQPHIAVAGWSTLGNIVALKPDNLLDVPAFERLLGRVGQTIHSSPNRVRSAMNGFVIAVGTYVSPLTDEAITTANKIDVVTVEKEGTARKGPSVADYILKARSKEAIGKKKKTVKC
jgi:3-methyladenine DNA glycosylase AlkD